MRQMATRMESTEMRQQQIMAFLARAVNNPAFLQQLLSARQNQRTLDNKGMPQAKCYLGTVQASGDVAGQTHPKIRFSLCAGVCVACFLHADALCCSTRALGTASQDMPQPSNGVAHSLYRAQEEAGLAAELGPGAAASLGR